jgi:uncharacterized protein
MMETAYLAALLLGLLGGVHCIGMCGGIVSAISIQPVIPGCPASHWPLQLAYNMGRISSYVIAGALVGTLGSIGFLFEDMWQVQLSLYLAAHLMLIALGLYLCGLPQGLRWAERAGQHIWRHVQPLTGRFLPVRSVAQAYPLGLLWGWLPCGMVYSILLTALLSGSTLRGAGLMLAFGLGTLPNLLLAGLLLRRFRSVIQSRYLRLASGLLILGFGVWGVLNPPSLGGRLWSGIVC